MQRDSETLIAISVSNIRVNVKIRTSFYENIISIEVFIFEIMFTNTR